MGFRRMKLVVRMKVFGGMKITYKILSEYLNAICSRGLKKNIRTYLGIFGNWIPLIQNIGQLCNTQSDAVSLFYCNSCREIFT